MSKREERMDEGEIALQGEGDGQVHRHHHESLKHNEEKNEQVFPPSSVLQSAPARPD